MVPLILGAALASAAHATPGRVPEARPGTTVVLRYAGRARSAGATLLLEAGGDGARVLRIDDSGRLLSTLALSRTPVALESSGLAESQEGLLWALADRGHSLVGFDPASGAVADLRTLPAACQLVWGIGGVVMVATLPPSGGRPLVLRMQGERFLPCESVRTRPVRDALEAPILAMWSCGASNTPEVPCWWVAGSSVVHWLAPSGSARTGEVPTLVPKRSAGSTSQDPVQRFSYPIRDIFQIDADRAWILTNQEGEKTPFEEGASLARHVSLVAGGRVRKKVTLPRKARLVLAGDTAAITVLFSDGTVERIWTP